MKLNSPILGEIIIEPQNLITFPAGIPGFEDQKQFAIIPMDEKSPFFYLQAINEPDLCLVLADPFTFFSNYQIKLDNETIDLLEAVDEPIIGIYSILTIPENFKETTANLMAPIIINYKTKKGLQFIPQKSDYNTKHKIFPQQEKPTSKAVNEGL